MFNIIAMPRCRTAWLSNLLTYKDIICLHDWYGNNKDKNFLSEDIGFIDTCSHDNFSVGDTVFIHRSVDDCINSLKKAFTFPTGFEWDIMEMYLTNHKDWLERQCGHHFDYSELSNYDTIAKIWEICLPYPVDKGRLIRMENLKITVSYNNILDAYESHDKLKLSLGGG